LTIESKILNYRPDIDGLRAVAVLSVVIYHAFPFALPGGFAGVDIFFVISGYLISGILFKSLAEGRFSFVEFYARRIRRIFPALIVMLILIIAAGYYYLLSDEFEQIGKHIAASCVFIQNITFLNESGYFDSASELKPLLHLWSLAVEEQFYICFPPLLIVLFRNKWSIAWILVAFISISFLSNLVISEKDNAKDFFLTQYRCWELIAGGLLSFTHFSKGHGTRFGNVYSIFGLVLITFSLVCLNDSNPYPGWRAVLPVTGAVLLIAAGPTRIINRWLLSNPITLWVGLISYPLYLFHWPLLSFLHILKGKNPTASSITTAVVLSFVLAAVTYHLIEKRIRYSRSRWTIPILIAAFLISGGVGILIWQKKLSPRSSDLGFDEHVKASLDKNYFEGLKATRLNKTIQIYEFNKDCKQTLYIGDSHMQQCVPRILKLCKNGQAGDRGFLFLTFGGLAPIPGLSGSFGAQAQPYDIFIPRMLELANQPNVDRIVIAANWCFYFNWGSKKHEIKGLQLNVIEGLQAALASFRGMLESFVANGKEVYVILNIATEDSFHPKYMIDREINGKISIKPRSYTVRDFREIKGEMQITQGELMDRIKSLAEKAGAKVINPLEFLSKDGICFRFFDGLPVYRDGNHLRASFVRDHATYLDETIIP
jgi:peptidoglycan/LPS O-acetylase OafA/YrhL